MELKKPKRKRRVRNSLQQPFPILSRDVTAIPTNKALWEVYTGRYSGDFVVVDTVDEMAALHNMGFFGKGSLSRAGPEFGKERQGVPAFIKQRQLERRHKWAVQQEEMINQLRKDGEREDVSTKNKDECNEQDEEVTHKKDDEISIVTSPGKNEDMNVDVTTIDDDNKPGDSNRKVEEVIMLDSAEEDNGSKAKDRKRKSDEEGGGIEAKKKSSETATSRELGDNLERCRVDGKRSLLVLPDSDDDDDEGYLTNISPRLEKEPFPVHESLHLTLEESFFLSFGLGCLQVIDLFGQFLSLDGMWQLFCKSQKDFIQKYVTYHYFRSKGWVVKPGIKFGGDFLLYKQGPPFYHASYIVLVDVVDSVTLKRLPVPRQTLTWTRLMGLNRLAESAGKEVLLCQVIWPSLASRDELEFPSVLSKFEVHEVLIRRWISSQEREENDSF